MKRIFKSILLSLALIMCVVSPSLAKSTRIQIKINGQKKNASTCAVDVNGFRLYSPYESYVHGGRTFVPIRELTELMGANVQWNNKTKSATIRLQGKEIKLKINSAVVYIDGKKTTIQSDSVPRLAQYIQRDNACKTMVPLRFLSESLGFDVQWNQGNMLASIANGVVQAPERQDQAKTPTENPKKDTQSNKDSKANGKQPDANQAKDNHSAAKQTPKVNRPKGSKPTIVLDAGHGGKDSGAVGVDGTKEKSLALRLAFKVEALLKERGYTTIMTRTTDEYIQLYDRADIANNNNTDIFLSMHFNSAGSTKAVGIEVLYASEKDVELKKDAGDQTRLAKEVLNAVLKETGLSSRGIKNRPDLAVLRKTEMTAILVEGGFMSNPAEMDTIKTDSYLDKLAHGIVIGIENYEKKYM